MSGLLFTERRIVGAVKGACHLLLSGRDSAQLHHMGGGVLVDRDDRGHLKDGFVKLEHVDVVFVHIADTTGNRLLMDSRTSALANVVKDSRCPLGVARGGNEGQDGSVNF